MDELMCANNSNGRDNGAVIVTDRAGFIQSLNAEAAKLLNVGMGRLGRRQLSLFFVKGRLDMLAALRHLSSGPLRTGGAVIQPIGRRTVPVTVDVTQEDDGLQWVLRPTAESEVA